MVDQALKRVGQAQAHSWKAFKNFINLHGYMYYEIPPELKYRYPAPGSCPLTREDRPNLYKKHWKTPFRDSVYNIRPREKFYSDAENTTHHIQAIPQVDPEASELDRLLALEPQPQTDDLRVAMEHTPDSEEYRKELWAHFDAQADAQETLRREHAPWNNYLDDTYQPMEFLVGGADRAWTGLENDERLKTVAIEFEYWVEKVVGRRQIEAKEVPMYKGTTKKWQILDDEAVDRDQIELLQAAVQAPLPEELEMYKEKHDKPLLTPINNETTRAWRDDPLATDSADFDPDFLQIDREKRAKYFLERYEQPKQLQ